MYEELLAEKFQFNRNPPKRVWGIIGYNRYLPYYLFPFIPYFSQLPLKFLHPLLRLLSVERGMSIQV